MVSIAWGNDVPRFVIVSGLKAEDRVVVSGLLRAVPGQKVDPQVKTAAAQ